MSLARYALFVLMALALSQGLMAAGLSGRLSGDARRATALAGALAAANTIAAYALVLWSRRRSATAFFRAVLGGMIGRMAVLLAAVVLALRALDLPQGPFVAALFAYYVAALGFELFVVSRLTRAPAGQPR